MAVTQVQSHFRIRADATAAQGGTPVWVAAQDVSWKSAINQPFRIRFSISSTGTTSATTNLFTIEVSRNGGAYGNVTSSTFVAVTDATNGASSDNSAITTSLITGTGTFQTVGQYDSTGATATVAITHGDYAEFEFGLKLLTTAVPGDTYDFRMYFPSGTVLATYSVTPRVTAVAAFNISGPMLPWTPDAISDGSLELWFDAATGVATSGANVTSWTDRNHSVAATLTHGATAPTYIPNLLNGLPGIVCTSGGGLGNTTTGTTYADFNNAISALVVMQTNTNNWQTAFGAYVTTFGEPTFGFDPGSPAPIAIEAVGVNDTASTQTLALATNAIAEWVAPAISGGSWTGVQPYITGTAGAVIPPMTIGAFSQAGFQIFCDANGGYGGNVHEIVVLNDAVDTATRQLIEGYLAWKWGLQASLPGGHPYLSAAPTIPTRNNPVTYASYASWIPPSPQPIVAERSAPQVAAAPPVKPPWIRDPDIRGAVYTSWIPLVTQPVVPRKTSVQTTPWLPIGLAQGPDIQEAVYASWIPQVLRPIVPEIPLPPPAPIPPATFSATPPSNPRMIGWFKLDS